MSHYDHQFIHVLLAALFIGALFAALACLLLNTISVY